MPHFWASLQDYPKTYEGLEEVVSGEHHLTQREVDIIQCIADGLTNKEIAGKLFLSELTVEAYLKNIFRKTGVRNRTELATQISSPWIFSKEKVYVAKNTGID